MTKIKRAAIVGGTHGNEFTGIYLIKKFEKYPALIKRHSFETFTLLGNPRAFEESRRYIDKDLNRCFLKKDLHDTTLSSYEDIRAKNIHKILGPKGNSQVDVIVDLHSTTTNMGLSIILKNEHPFLLKLAAYLSSINPLVKVCCAASDRESSFLRSLCELGFVVEVGPVAQSVLSAEWFQKTEELIYTILNYLDSSNQGTAPPSPSAVTVYFTISDVDYPRNERGEIQAMIHPQLQFRDYEPLHPGDPMFLTFDGKEIPYVGESTVYPIFINEAAYYEKGVAMCFTKKQEILLSSHDVIEMQPS
ncbi:aspartoacylase [Scytonema hofmannii PCC 7110]|uniref:Probable aspartoacylase n=1 Tax=Scytonema hofmannii PCC 7110 TaxID=128403 RepID=A0A139XDT0_9CYAN|nr:aspartoacylase [Scytonema hofmannii]KYC42762.1 aspartoacylase [Scytonema hofmannii PCC 7110]